MKIRTKPRGFAIAAVVLLVTMSFAPGMASAYDEPDAHWERDNSARVHTGYEWINVLLYLSIR